MGSRCSVWSLMTLACCVSWGCGGGSTERRVDLVPVSGKITLNGKPEAGVSVSFIPDQAVGGNGAFGTTDASGAYVLFYRTGQEGAIPGKYNVLFSKLTMPDGSPLPPDVMAADAGAIEQIPDRYRDMEKVAHFVEISPTGGNFDFDLKK